DIADLATAQAVITTLRQEVARTRQENAALRAQLDALCRRLYGKSSERVSPDQLRLAFAQLGNESGPATDPVEMDSGERPGPEKRRRARRPTGRRPLPAHLPRRRVEIDVPDADKTCACGHAKTCIGETVAEKL